MPVQARPQVIHQAGAQHLETLKAAYARADVDADCVTFIDDMAGALANADLLVCRAGAMTVSEVAAVGIPQKNSLALLPRKIGDVSIEYIQYDDASDPTQAVQLAKKLISEHNVDALIGPSGSPNAILMQ